MEDTLDLDLAIIGSGLAGCVAAVEAHDADPAARIAIFEKAPEAEAGGNSRASGQALWIARPERLEAVLEYQRRLNEPNPVPEPLLKTWAEALVNLEPWIRARAAEGGGKYVLGMGWSDDIDTIVEFPELGAAEAVDYNSTIHPNPSGVWRTFHELVKRRPVAVHYATPALELLQDADGAVTGVIVGRNGRRVRVNARRGVILACGGYEANLDMQRNFWGADQIRAVGSPHNTGDGIRMLMKAGARLWHMRNFTQSSGNWPSFRVDGYDSVFLRNVIVPGPGSWFEIAADHRRFYDEGYHHRLRHYHEFRHGRWQDARHCRVTPVHMIFDDATRTAGSLSTNIMGWNATAGGYTWSGDNSVEVERGWISRGDTVEELAGRIDRPADALAAAIDEFNAAARGERPCPFGRSTGTMRPLSGPPWYAIEIVPGLICSTGGGARDERCRVLDWQNRPIPGLYEAGELGSMFSNLYQNGAFLTEAMISGRIAGREAVARRGAAAAAKAGTA